MTSVIGVLGGSFDPIHRGHLQLGRDALAQLPLAELRLLVAGSPWQKTDVGPAADRVNMVELAIGSFAPAAWRARLRLDRREVDRAGPTYTVDSLNEIRAEVGADTAVVLIIGADQMSRLDTWHEWQRLFDFAHLAVAQRPQVPMRLSPPLTAFCAGRWSALGELAALPAGRIGALAMTPVDASGTEIRALCRAADATDQPPAAVIRRLAELLPPAVLNYIRAHALYGHNGH